MTGAVGTGGPELVVVLEQVLVGVGLFVGAALAHEAAHAVAARLLGGQVVAVDIRGLEVRTAWPQDSSDWRPRLVGVAPLLAGVALTAALALTGRLPADIVGGGALALFTVGGSLEDYRLAWAEGERPELTRQQQGMAFALLGFLLTLALLATNWVVLPAIAVLSLIGGIFGSGIGLATTILLRDECRDGGASPPAESRPGSEGSQNPAVGDGSGAGRAPPSSNTHQDSNDD